MSQIRETYLNRRPGRAPDGSGFVRDERAPETSFERLRAALLGRHGAAPDTAADTGRTQAPGSPGRNTEAAPEPDRGAALARKILDGFHALRGARAVLELEEGRELRVFQKQPVQSRLGFQNFGDLCRLLIGMDPKTARGQIAALELVEKNARVADAFLDGALTKCQIAALAPVLKDATPEETAPWLARCGELNVKELRLSVQEHRRAQRSTGADGDTGTHEARRIPEDISDSGGEDDDQGNYIKMRAPISVALLYDQTIEMARNHLGCDASVNACMEAILAEALPKMPDPDPPLASDPAPACTPELASTGPAERLLRPLEPVPLPPPSPEAVVEAHENLRVVYELVQDVKDLAGETLGGPPLTGTEPNAPREALLRIRQIERLARPIRIMEGRLLTDLQRIRGHRRLGYRTIDEFATLELKLSVRSARRLRSEAEAFGDRALLRDAYTDGRISASTAVKIDHVAAGSTLGAWILRGEHTTARQFDNEIRLIERVNELHPGLAPEGPLHDPKLEGRLIRALVAYGRTPESIEAELKARGLGKEEVGTPESDLEAARRGGWKDPDWRIYSPLERDALTPGPAGNPLLMRRYEVLFEMLVHECAALDLGKDRAEEERVAVKLADAVSPENCPERSTCTLPVETWRPNRTADTKSGRPPSVNPIHAFGHRARIRFWLDSEIGRKWKAAQAYVSEMCWVRPSGRELLPDWAVLALLCDAAMREWRKVDPERKPKWDKILTRDGHHCVFPGCTNRKMLEVHHMEYGNGNNGKKDDSPSNLVAMCSVHHHHSIHEGDGRVSGHAPTRILWEVGGRLQTANPPLMVVLGQFIISRI